MSSKFSHCQVITQDEHDTGKPSKPRKKTRKRTNLAARRRSNSIAITQDDPRTNHLNEILLSRSRSKSRSPSPSKPKWHKQHKRDDVVATSLRVKLEKWNRHVPIAIQVLV